MGDATITAVPKVQSAEGLVDARGWVVELCYDGKEPFWFGTLFMPFRAGEDEVKAEVAEVLAKYLPCPPTILSVRRGHVTVVLDNQLFAKAAASPGTEA